MAAWLASPVPPEPSPPPGPKPPANPFVGAKGLMLWGLFCENPLWNDGGGRPPEFEAWCWELFGRADCWSCEKGAEVSVGPPNLLLPGGMIEDVLVTYRTDAWDTVCVSSLTLFRSVLGDSDALRTFDHEEERTNVFCVVEK